MTTFMTPVEVIPPTEPPSPSPTARTPLDTLLNNAGQSHSSRQASALQDVEHDGDAQRPNTDTTPPSSPRHRAQNEAELPTWTPLAVTDRIQVDDDGDDALPTPDALQSNKAAVRNALQQKMHRVASESLTHTTPPRTQGSGAEEKQSAEARRAERTGGVSQQDTHVDELDLLAQDSPPAPVRPRPKVTYNSKTKQRTIQSSFPAQPKTASTSTPAPAPAPAQQTITDSLVALFNKQTSKPVPKPKDASTSKRAPRPRPSFPHPVQEVRPAQSPSPPGPARAATKPKPRSALAFAGVELPTLQSVRAASKAAQPARVSEQKKRKRSPSPTSSSCVSDSQSRSRQSSSRTSDPANAAAESLADAIARVYAQYSSSPVKHPRLDVVKAGTTARPAAKRRRSHLAVETPATDTETPATDTETPATDTETPIDVDVDDDDVLLRVTRELDMACVGPPVRTTAMRWRPRPVVETPTEDVDEDDVLLRVTRELGMARVGPPARPTAKRRPLVETPTSVPETPIETDDDDRPLVSASEEHPPAADQLPQPKPKAPSAPSGGGLLSALNATFTVNKDKDGSAASYQQIHTRPKPVVLLQRRGRPHLGETKEPVVAPPRRRRPPREVALSARQVDALLGTEPLPLDLALPPGTFTHHDAEGEVVEVVGWWEGDELEERVKMDVRMMVRSMADHATQTRTGNPRMPRPVMRDETSRVLMWVDRLEGLFGPGDVARGDRNKPPPPTQSKKRRRRRVVVNTDSNNSSRYGSARRDIDSRAASVEDGNRARTSGRLSDDANTVVLDVPDEQTMLSWTGALHKLAKGKTTMDREAMQSLSSVLTLVDTTKDSISSELLTTTRLAQSMALVSALDEIPFGDEHGMKERATRMMQHWQAKFPDHFPVQL